jgi:foldase protein PrsA
MKKKVFVLSLCLLLATGCGSKIPKLENGQEAVVTLNESDSISVDDLYENIKSEYALEALISMVDKKILEDKYKDNISDATTYAESTMQSLEENYGDDLEQMIAYYTSYSSKEAYQESLYLSYLQDLATKDYAKDQVTDKEIKNYYKNEVIGDIEISHILITPDVTDSMTDDEQTQAETDAENKAKEIIKELKNADNVETKFAELAKENSQDESTASNGGSLGYINYGTLGDDYDSLIDAAVKLKNGAYSTTVIKTSLGYHVILRTNQKDKSSLDDIKDTIIETLAEDKISEDSTIAVKAMQALRKDYNMEIQDSELKEQYANYIQNALSQSE